MKKLAEVINNQKSLLVDALVAFGAVLMLTLDNPIPGIVCMCTAYLIARRLT